MQMKTDMDTATEAARTMVAENKLRREALAARRAAEAAPPQQHYASERERLRHDFAHWCRRCVKIRHKLTGRMVPLELNAPQRRLVAALERQRLRGEPLRVVLLKSRQWGGSTVVQMYMAWIQCVHRENWHSLICAHVKDTSSTIRGMYAAMLAGYPPELWEGEEAPALRPYEGSSNRRLIAGRGCVVTVGSAENQDAARGTDIAMAHLSEVAFWKETPFHSPDDLVRSVCSGIAMEPLTMIVLESTANGVGNFFHTLWLRARAGESAFEPVFVAWHDIEIYSLPTLADPEALRVASEMDAYEQALWERGLTLEQIGWYHRKRREAGSMRAMMTEYPSDETEAFVSTSRAVFAPEAVEKLRHGCSEAARRGEVTGGRFVADSKGCLQVWRAPDEWPRGTAFLAVVDIGGRSEGADWSVVCVLAAPPGALPEVAAQWRGHIDHDLLVKVAVEVASWYGRAYLVVESNTLEQHSGEDGAAIYVLEELAQTYTNIYRRVHRDTATQTVESRLGFHTNTRTKPLVVATLIAAVREGAYVERCAAAADELATYERLPGGSYAARRGYHDDMLMTRAIGLYVLSTMQDAGGRAAAASGWMHREYPFAHVGRVPRRLPVSLPELLSARTPDTAQ